MLLLEIVKQPALIIVLVLNLLLLHRYKSLKWETLEQGKLIRRFIMLVALVFAWKFNTYDFNLYYGEAHYLDRLLVIALACAVYFIPLSSSALYYVLLVHCLSIYVSSLPVLLMDRQKTTF